MAHHHLLRLLEVLFCLLSFSIMDGLQVCIAYKSMGSCSGLFFVCSMDTSGALLAAGGKNGHAAVFGIQQALVSRVCCSFSLLPLLLCSPATAAFAFMHEP